MADRKRPAEPAERPNPHPGFVKVARVTKPPVWLNRAAVATVDVCRRQERAQALFIVLVVGALACIACTAIAKAFGLL